MTLLATHPYGFRGGRSSVQGPSTSDNFAATLARRTIITSMPELGRAARYILRRYKTPLPKADLCIPMFLLGVCGSKFYTQVPHYKR